MSEKEDGPAVILTLAKKITSELAEVKFCSESLTKISFTAVAKHPI